MQEQIDVDEIPKPTTPTQTRQKSGYKTKDIENWLHGTRLSKSIIEPTIDIKKSNIAFAVANDVEFSGWPSPTAHLESTRKIKEKLDSIDAGDIIARKTSMRNSISSGDIIARKTTARNSKSYIQRCEVPKSREILGFHDKIVNKLNEISERKSLVSKSISHKEDVRSSKEKILNQKQHLEKKLVSKSISNKEDIIIRSSEDSEEKIVDVKTQQSQIQSPEPPIKIEDDRIFETCISDDTFILKSHKIAKRKNALSANAIKNLQYPKSPVNSKPKEGEYINTTKLQIQQAEIQHQPLTSCYLITKIISSTPQLIILKAIRLSDDFPCLLKLAPDESSERLNIEYQHLRNITGIGVPTLLAYEYSIELNMRVLVLEDMDGEFLSNLITRNGKSVIYLPSGLSMEQLLLIFISLAKCLEGVHGYSLIHRMITPECILYNQTAKKIQLFDFELSSLLSNEVLPNDKLSVYHSPELRANKPVDKRSDLYSLGAVIFFCIMGYPPYDPQQIGVNPIVAGMEFPKSIQHIVMKLLEYSPNDRYQDSTTLIRDIGLLIENINTPLVNFTEKINSQFIIPKKLLRRTNDISKFISIFESLQTKTSVHPYYKKNTPANTSPNTSVNKPLFGKTCKSIFVAGETGIGKTSFLSECKEYVIARNGCWYDVKCEQFRDVPYGALVEVMNGVCREKRVKEKFALMMAGLESILIELCPNMEHVLQNTYPTLPTLDPKENQYRFHSAIKRFFNCLSSPENPTVIVFDDFHNIDEATLELLHQIIVPETESILFVFSYLLKVPTQENKSIEISSNVSVMQSHIKSQPLLSMNEIYLQPLKTEHVVELIVESCNRKEDDVEVLELAKLIHYKCRFGNPLYVVETLQFLYDNNCFQIVENQDQPLRYKWDYQFIITQINRISVLQNHIKIPPPNVRDLLDAKKKNKPLQLPPTSQVGLSLLMLRDAKKITKSCRRILQVGSILGPIFSLTPILFGMKTCTNDIIRDINLLITDKYLIPVTFWASRLSEFMKPEYFMELAKTEQLLYKFSSDQFMRCVYKQNAMIPSNLSYLNLWCARLIGNFETGIEFDSLNLSTSNMYKAYKHYQHSIKDCSDLSDEESWFVITLAIKLMERDNKFCLFNQTLEIYYAFELLVQDRREKVKPELPQQDKRPVNALSKLFVKHAKIQPIDQDSSSIQEIEKFFFEAHVAASLSFHDLSKFYHIIDLMNMNRPMSNTQRFELEVLGLQNQGYHDEIKNGCINNLKRLSQTISPTTPKLKHVGNVLFWFNLRKSLFYNIRTPFNINETDEKSLDILKLLYSLSNNSFKENNMELFQIASLKGLSFSLKRSAHNKFLSLFFVGTAMAQTNLALISRNRKSVSSAFQLTLIADELTKSILNETPCIYSSFVSLSFVYPWNVELRSLVDPLFKLYQDAFMFGEIEIACISFYNYLRFCMYSGKSLELIEQSVLLQWPIILTIEKSLKYPIRRLLKGLCSILNCLKETTSTKEHDLFIKEDENYEELKCLSEIYPVLAYYLSGDMALECFYREKWYSAFNLATISLPTFKNDKKTHQKIVLDYPFTRFIAVLSACKIVNYEMLIEKNLGMHEDFKEKLAFIFRDDKYKPGVREMRQIKKQLKILKNFAKQGRKYFDFISKLSPENHSHRLLLIDAEIAIFQGKPHLKICDLYNSAYIQANNHGFTNESAFILQQLAHYNVTKLEDQAAAVSYRKALEVYKNGGANLMIPRLLEFIGKNKW